MPLHQNQDGTWQWGKSGKKYKKKQDAIKQMKAIFASGYVEKKASYKSYTDVLGMIKKAAEQQQQHFTIPKGFILGKNWKDLSAITGDTSYKNLLRRLSQYNKGFNPDKLIAGKKLNLGVPAEKYPSLSRVYDLIVSNQTGPYKNKYIRTKAKGTFSAFGPLQLGQMLTQNPKRKLTPQEATLLTQLREQRKQFLANKKLDDPVWGRGGTGNINWTDKNKALYKSIGEAYLQDHYNNLTKNPANSREDIRNFFRAFAKRWYGHPKQDVVNKYGDNLYNKYYSTKQLPLTSSLK